MTVSVSAASLYVLFLARDMEAYDMEEDGMIRMGDQWVHADELAKIGKVEGPVVQLMAATRRRRAGAVELDATKLHLSALRTIFPMKSPLEQLEAKKRLLDSFDE